MKPLLIELEEEARAEADHPRTSFEPMTHERVGEVEISLSQVWLRQHSADIRTHEDSPLDD
jgi:hypothetical protein